MKRDIQVLAIAATLLVTLLPEVSLAHIGGGMTGGLVSGFTHPILGWDHVVAMMAVGLWGAFLGAVLWRALFGGRRPLVR